MSPELKAFIDRVIVPALLERFLRDQQAEPGSEPVRDVPKPEARV